MKIKICLLILSVLTFSVSAAVSDDYAVELGKTYLKRGDLDQAQIEFARALAENPENAAARKYLDQIEKEDPAKEQTASGGGLHAISFFTGFLDERMKYEHDHRGLPFLVSLGFDGRPFFSKIGIHTEGRLDFIIEPFINLILRPKEEVEIGSGFLLEYAFPLTDWVQPYIKGGLGITYMTQEIEEQSTQFNFIPQGSVGLHFRLKDNLSFSCEYRHRHLSNASIKEPNKGIDAKMYLAGLTFFFE